jgi:TP901 family phage tail tape measure protein
MAATDVSEAVYQAISGSVDTANAVGFVDKANRLAVAGFTELTNATDILTTTLNAYKLEASQVGGVSNVLIRTQNLGKTSVDELSASMGKAIATGSAYGVNLQNIATAYVEITRGGIATAEATTYISGMLNELGKAGSDVAGILQEQTGQSFGQLMAGGATLGDVLQILSDTVNGDAEAFMNLWGSQEAAKAANALLTQGIEDFNQVAAQMDDELAGVTGTTDAAYATMTNTAEFVEKRLQNSIKNLGIAYGEKLSPFLTKAAEGLAKFVEGATEYVDKNPGVVAAVTGITVAMTAFAASVSALVVAKKAAAAMEALNLTMSANPALALAGAIAAVTVALGTMATVMITDMNQAYEEATASARELEEAMTSGKAAMEDNLLSVEASANMAGHYIDRLEELDAISEKTTAEQQEYHTLLALLVETVPELADRINLETDAIEGGTDALRAQTDAWKENAKAQAMQDYLADLYAKHAATMAQAEVSRIKLNKAESSARAIEAELNDLYDQRSALEAQAASDNAALTDAWYETQAAIDEMTGRLAACNDEIDEYNREIAKDEEATAAATAEIEAAEQAVENLTGAAREGAVVAGEAGTTAQTAAADLSAWTDAVDALQAAYTTAKTEAETSIMRQINLFEQAAEVVPTSVATITSALESNAAYMDQYAENLRKAAELGVDQGLLKHLSDGSVESARILAGIVEDEGQHIDEMNEAWHKVEEGKDNLSGELALYSDEVEQAKNEMVGIAEQAGLDIGSKLTSSLANGLPAFLAVVDQYTAALRGIHAPGENGRGYPTTTGYAGGTSNAAAGYAIVGENGPELVYLHGGERILSAEETRAATRQLVPYAPYIDWTGGTAPGAGGRYQTETTIIVPVQLDGREIARSTATYMGEEMAFEVM